MPLGVKKFTDIWAMSVTLENWCHLTGAVISLPRKQTNKYKGLPRPDIHLTFSRHTCLPLSLSLESGSKWQGVSQ